METAGYEHFYEIFHRTWRSWNIIQNGRLYERHLSSFAGWKLHRYTSRDCRKNLGVLFRMRLRLRCEARRTITINTWRSGILFISQRSEALHSALYTLIYRPGCDIGVDSDVSVLTLFIYKVDSKLYGWCLYCELLLRITSELENGFLINNIIFMKLSKTHATFSVTEHFSSYIF